MVCLDPPTPCYSGPRLHLDTTWPQTAPHCAPRKCKDCTTTQHHPNQRTWTCSHSRCLHSSLQGDSVRSKLPATGAASDRLQRAVQRVIKHCGARPVVTLCQSLTPQPTHVRHRNHKLVKGLQSQQGHLQLPGMSEVFSRSETVCARSAISAA